jgi:hypothetical protein
MTNCPTPPSLTPQPPKGGAFEVRAGLRPFFAVVL